MFIHYKYMYLKFKIFFGIPKLYLDIPTRLPDN